MSVLIKGMKMPKDGAYWCEINVAGDIALITIHGEDRKSFHLVELHDHGDLVDRDALMPRLGMEMDCEDCPNCTALYFCGLPREVMEVCDELENAPVVIPAERSKNDEKSCGDFDSFIDSFSRMCKNREGIKPRRIVKVYSC